MTEEQTPFTIESFYSFLKESKLMGAKCSICGKILVPPRPMCPECLKKKLQWKRLQTQGKLLTYSIIHISPERFKTLTPYAVGIVELEDGARLPGMIKQIDFDKIHVGMTLHVGFETETETTKSWPTWARYYFKPQ